MAGTVEVSDIRRHAQEWAHQYAGRRLAIFGAGPLGADILRCLRECGSDVVGAMDDYMVPGSELEGMPIVPSKAFRSIQPDAVILGTTKTRRLMRDRLVHVGYRGDVLCLPGEDDNILPPAEHGRVREMEKFHNLHAGQRAFVIGNGPSLTRTDPRTIEHAVTFGCNSIFQLEGFVPTYYCVTDKLCAEDHHERINALPWTKFFPRSLERWLTGGYSFNADFVPDVDTFHNDFAGSVQVGAAVTVTMLELALYMGCDPVYLIGVDHSYNVSGFQKDPGRAGVLLASGDANHFGGGCARKEHRIHIPRVDYMEAEYRVARDAYARHGRGIYNATAGGKLEIFERIDFQQVVKTHAACTKGPRS